MKQLRKPTRQQKVLMKQWRLNPADWFVERDTPEEMVIVHRFSETTRKTIIKEMPL